MQSTTKRNRCALGILALAHFLLFLVYYEVAAYAESDLAVDIVAAFVNIALAVALSLSGAYALTLLFSDAKRRPLGSALPFATRLLYALPYNYIYFVIAEGYSTVEALLLGLLAGLLECAALWGGYLLIAYLLRKSEKKTDAVSLCAPLLPLLLSGARTIVETVKYLVEFFERIYLEDLLFYLLDLLLAVVAFAISYVLLRYLQRKQNDDAQENSD